MIRRIRRIIAGPSVPGLQPLGSLKCFPSRKMRREPIQGLSPKRSSRLRNANTMMRGLSIHSVPHALRLDSKIAAAPLTLALADLLTLFFCLSIASFLLRAIAFPLRRILALKRPDDALCTASIESRPTSVCATRDDKAGASRFFCESAGRRRRRGERP